MKKVLFVVVVLIVGLQIEAIISPSKEKKSDVEIYATKNVANNFICEKFDHDDGQFWFYHPKVSDGQKLTLVAIAAAGSNCISGVELTEDSEPEHLPYVNAGMCVLAYDIPGVFNEDDSDFKVHSAVHKYLQSRCGFKSLDKALNYALENYDCIDQNKIAVAGHSSASLAAFNACMFSTRIKYCMAYCPIVDYKTNFGEGYADIKEYFPTLYKFFTRNNPLTSCKDFHADMFVFQSMNDFVVSPSKTTEFVKNLKKLNKPVTYHKVPTGTHYDSMIDVGVPAAIKWLKSK